MSAVLKNSGNHVIDPIHRGTRVLIISEAPHEASTIRDLLLGDFDDVLTSSEGPVAVEKFQSTLPDVLILGFPILSAAETQYLAIWRGAKEVVHPHRAVVLCKTSDVRQAYALCMRGIFDDYVQYWPMSLDPMRLAMAVHLAHRSLEVEVEEVRETSAQRCERTVLIVDDDPLQRSAVATILKDQDYNLIFASNGVEALGAMQLNKPDVVLLDVMMPEMDGAETIRQMKGLERFSSIPVLMMAGDSRGVTVKSTIAAGARDFLVKPIVGPVLIDKLKRALLSDS